MLYGYARCSTNESKQDINRQVNELKKQGAEEIILEYEHGDSRVKKALNALLATAKEGDTIMTLEVSRLSRSTKQLCELIELIKEKKLCLVIVNSITVNCHSGEIDSMTKGFLQMAGVFAEMELGMTRERVKSGLANAREKGKTLGRPKTTKDDIPTVFLKHYPQFKNKQLNITEFANICRMSRPTIYKYIGIIEA